MLQVFIYYLSDPVKSSANSPGIKSEYLRVQRLHHLVWPAANTRDFRLAGRWGVCRFTVPCMLAHSSLHTLSAFIVHQFITSSQPCMLARSHTCRSRWHRRHLIHHLRETPRCLLEIRGMSRKNSPPVRNAVKLVR
jgi:hypothetical protein